MTNAPSTLILGIGNYLMGDEGAGVHAVQLLEHDSLPPHVRLLDGGTGGFHLLNLFQEYNPIILIDATMDEKPPGTLSLIQPRFASEFPRTLSAHDIGLRDLIESATLIGDLPTMFLITVSISEIRPMSTELSSAVQQSLPAIRAEVLRILTALQSGQQVHP